MQKCELTDKDSIRKNAYDLRKTLFSDPKKHMDLSLQIQEHVLSSTQYQTCDFLCAYASIKGEASTDYLIEKAFKNHKKVLFPLCHTHEKGIMHYALCQNKNDLQQGRYNIPEPKEHCPIIPAHTLDSKTTLILVPALAFDKQGFRLGYGQGYYDRFMAKIPHATSMGLVFSTHLYDKLPRVEWDKAVNFLVTEQEIITM